MTDSGDYVLSGAKPGSAEFGSVGTTFGAKTHTLTAAQMPSHGHSFAATSSTSGNHAHNIALGSTILAYGNSATGFGSGLGAMYGGNNGFVAAAGGDHQHYVSGTTGGAGNDSAHYIIQPTRSATLVIRV